MQNQYKLRTFTCVGCGCEVTKRLPEGRKFCSVECFRKSPRPARKTGVTKCCESCGIEFYVAKNRAHVARFCSKSCADVWQSRFKDTYVCKTCGVEFRKSPSWKIHGTPTYCCIACRDADPDRREMLIQMNVKQASMSINKFETDGYAMLDEIGLSYQRQHLIGGKFCVDAFVSAVGLVVQFDGDYWHGNPSRFPNPDERQLRRMALDASQDAYMRACGYAVFRIWESDFRKNVDRVKIDLLTIVSKLQTEATDHSFAA